VKKRYRGITAELAESARAHRKVPTEAEERLWQAIRRQQIEGARFRRQHPLGTFVLDFCCPELRLVIEVDGPIHDMQQERDRNRTELLEAHGYRVIRFRNDQVMHRLDEVVAEIRAAILDGRSPPSPWSSGG
jgi:very-short-patch-repair endonuclease